MLCQRWLIAGRVQGVGYRAWMSEKARALDVDGWVRNRSDGTVEAVVQGERDTLDQLYRDCLRGPPFASVDRIVIAQCGDPLPRRGIGFEQLPTV